MKEKKKKERKVYRLVLEGDEIDFNPPKNSFDFFTLRTIYEYTTKFEKLDDLLNKFKNKYKLIDDNNRLRLRIDYYTNKKKREFEDTKLPIYLKKDAVVLDEKQTEDSFKKLCESNSEFIAYFLAVYRNSNEGLFHLAQTVEECVMANDTMFHIDLMYKDIAKSFKGSVELYKLINRFKALKSSERIDYSVGLSPKELDGILRKENVSLIPDYMHTKPNLKKDSNLSNVQGEEQMSILSNNFLSNQTSFGQQNPYFELIPTDDEELDDIIRKVDVIGMDQLPESYRIYLDDLLSQKKSEPHK